jgi:CMP-N-acetylneuraminic acid synthetase
LLISKEVTGKITTLDAEDQKILDATIRQPCCIIPARAGSKRIKHKNRRLLNGRPLVDYALKAALDSGVFHLIIVTSDDTKILEHAYSYFSTEKVQPQKRPKTLCGDKSPIRVAIRYAIQSYEVPNTICLLQPTNPLITAEQIKKAYDLYCEKKPNYLFGVCKGQDIGFHFFERNQFFTDFEKLWDVEYLPFEMEGVDIDTEADWLEAERLLNER